jgi:(1->4)-alpha-D-glucan 1-alpha-D-glucosylmutase
VKPAPLSATYRLQFNRNFTISDATRIIPYLHELGISHIYASPILKARAGSPHGYDIVDHNALNPEIGNTADLAACVEALHRHGMGLILDIVPNHMGVGGNDNAWWLDVLENGEASPYAAYFDIDWHPANPALHNKILLPFLGAHYGTVLEQGELQLVLDPEKGAFSVHYFEHLFPIDPRSYPKILALRTDQPGQQTGMTRQAGNALASLIGACQSLPRRTELSAAQRQKRQQGGMACKRQLAGLCREYPEIRAFLNENIKHINATPGPGRRFDPLHRLLEAQAYRLAYWQVASDEINYRRFFDINELAGIRMENSEVFAATHRLVRQLLGSGQVNGLRIDHPDGLSDPQKYCCDLQQLAAEARTDSGERHHAGCYLLVEKILASHEQLPADWPVAGTTGYETAYLLNGLFVYPDSEHLLGRLYRRFSGDTRNFDELLHERKQLVIHSVLASELTVLANLASSIAQTDRYTRDFTNQGLRAALAEIVACFPVYRTYITRRQISEADRRHVHWAIAQAKKRSMAADIQIYDFIETLLLPDRLTGYSSRIRRQIVQFALRFQQYTAPVMAKGMEDTAFYAYNRLVSLNDVGFDPRTFGVSTGAFHHANRERLDKWPQSMVTTSTHDSKRAGDIRARIDVLSEMPDEWRRHLARWSRINRHRKHLVDAARAPSRNDEYLLYQTLLGAWPVTSLDTAGVAAFRERVSACMLKAARESKIHTSWINPNREYEAAMQAFVAALLDDTGHNAFLADFVPFQQHVLRYGLLNSLSQTLLELTVPGIPDIYQGNELWAFNLVDPDNRRPVDYEHRQTQLQALVTTSRNEAALPGFLHDILDRIEDGRARLYLVWRTLGLRRRYPGVFLEGEYLDLEATGPRAGHLCSFARRLEDRLVVVVATRWFARLEGLSDRFTPGSPVWEDTWIRCPCSFRAGGFRNILSRESVRVYRHGDGARIRAEDLFRCFPVALLTKD